MNRHNQQNSLTPKALIYRIVITVTALFIVCLYMPRDERSTYQFDVGKPWRYSQLIATYDFPIYKSAETIQTEQDSILQHYEPYFAIDETVGKEQIEKFKATINGQKPATIPANYLAYVENKLEHIYAQGVMDTEDFDQMHSDEVASIRIFAQNVAKEQPMTQVFSHKTAYEYLIDLGEDSLHYDRRVLRKCNLSDYIVPNLTYDKTKSEESRKDLLSSLSYSSGMVMSGQKIIDRGDIVDKETYDILTSLEKEYTRRNTSKMQTHTVLLGQMLYVALIIACLTLYFNLFRRDYLANTRHILFIASMPVIYPLITSFLIKHNLFNVYIIPFAMAPIFIRVFMDSRTAFVTHVATVLISAISLKYPYEFIATQLVAGMVAIYSLREHSQRSKMILLCHIGVHSFLHEYGTYSRKRLRTPGVWHVYLYYHQRHPLVICLPVTVLVRKGFRLHLQRDSCRTVQHQQRTAETALGSGSGHIPTLHAGGEPGYGSGE